MTYLCESCGWTGPYEETLHFDQHCYCPDCRSDVWPEATELERKAIEPGLEMLRRAMR